MERSVKSTEVTSENDQLNAQESMNNRLARYIDRVRKLEVENRERFLKEADNRLAEQHETHANAIQELREKYENQMKTNREEIEALFGAKIKVVQNGSQRDKEALTAALNELKTAQNRIDDSNAKVVILEQINSSLHDRIDDLQTALESERSRSAKSLIEIDRLREEMAMHMEKHQEVMDAKHSMALEISLYDKLLSDAEKPFQRTASNLVAGTRKRKNGNSNSSAEMQ